MILLIECYASIYPMASADMRKKSLNLVLSSNVNSFSTAVRVCTIWRILYFLCVVFQELMEEKNGLFRVTESCFSCFFVYSLTVTTFCKPFTYLNATIVKHISTHQVIITLIELGLEESWHSHSTYMSTPEIGLSNSHLWHDTGLLVPYIFQISIVSDHLWCTLFSNHSCYR